MGRLTTGNAMGTADEVVGLQRGRDRRQQGNRRPGGDDGSRAIPTRLDGRFDLRMNLRGDRIVGMTKGGTNVKVVDDAARGVTWISEPGSTYEAWG